MNRASWWLGLPSLALFLLFLAAFAVGQFPVAPHDVGAVLWAKLTGTASGVPPTVETVIWQIRLPRIAAAVLIGAALAAAGATYQGLFRNPLVSPDILGVAAGAGLGAALAIFMGLSVAIIQVLAFSGGLGSVLVVYLIGTAMRGRDPILVLVLAGVAMGTLLGSAISLVKVFADPSSGHARRTRLHLSASRERGRCAPPPISFGGAPATCHRDRGGHPAYGTVVLLANAHRTATELRDASGDFVAHKRKQIETARDTLAIAGISALGLGRGV